MEQIFIWGTGKIANEVLAEYDVDSAYEVKGFIDNDPKKRGEIFKGKKIFPPDILKTARPDRIVVLTDYYVEIKKQIANIYPDKEILVESKNFFYKQSILKRYEEEKDPEIRQMLDYIRQNDLGIFNYDFADKYKELKTDVEYDPACRLFYVYHKDKKLYFAGCLNTEQKVRDYYMSLLIEQDSESPHKYLSAGFDVDEGDVVVDAGAAEGIFALEIIEKVSRVYIIESDREWITALSETFKEYGDKAVIIQKYVTSTDEREFATLDQLIKEPVNFIKMDIEGNEWDALLGSKKLIQQSEKLKCSICSYHSDFDETLIKCVLEDYGLECSTTPGYMWFPVKGRKSYIALKFCRGIVRGIKEVQV